MGEINFNSPHPKHSFQYDTSIFKLLRYFTFLYYIFKMQCVFYVFVQSVRHVWLFVSPWTAAFQAPMSSTISLSLPKFVSTESVRLSNHLILCPRKYLSLLLVYFMAHLISDEPHLTSGYFGQHRSRCLKLSLEAKQKAKRRSRKFWAR